MKNKIKVAIADDHTIIREGLRDLLLREQDIVIVGEAKNGIEAIELIVNGKPDVILLDVNMPFNDDFEVLVKIRDYNYDVKVILFTMHKDVEVLIKAIEIGIRGYVLKDSSIQTIIHAIRKIQNGEIFIEPSMVKYLFEEYEPRGEKPKEKNKKLVNNLFELTIREIEVLGLIVKGFLNKEIAGSLCISEKTVKSHVSHILRKMNVDDRTQAAVSAVKNRIVSI